MIKNQFFFSYMNYYQQSINTNYTFKFINFRMISCKPNDLSADVFLCNKS